MKKTTTVYLPGFGDSNDGLRKAALKKWESPEREVIFVPMVWDDREEKLDHKLERIGDAIRAAKGKVVLVGESAGGSIALVAYDKYQRNISQVITICGKNQGAEDVVRQQYRRHPAFRESMIRVDKIVEKLSMTKKKRIEIFYTKYDPTIRPEATLIDGVRSHHVPTIGHMFAIATMLTVFKHRIFAVIKRP